VRAWQALTFISVAACTTCSLHGFTYGWAGRGLCYVECLMNFHAQAGSSSACMSVRHGVQHISWMPACGRDEEGKKKKKRRRGRTYTDGRRRNMRKKKNIMHIKHLSEREGEERAVYASLFCWRFSKQRGAAVLFFNLPLPARYHLPSVAMAAGKGRSNCVNAAHLLRRQTRVATGSAPSSAHPPATYHHGGGCWNLPAQRQHGAQTLGAWHNIWRYGMSRRYL